jgi:hypothetical protein
LQVETNLVTPGYLHLMRIPLIAGRDFDPATEFRDELPVVISEVLAQALAPGESLLGHRLYVPARPGKNGSIPYRVIGIARNTIGRSLTEGPARMIYVPIRPIASAALEPAYFPGAMTVIVQTRTASIDAVPLVRRTLHAINPALALADERTLQDIVEASMSRTRLIAMLLAIGATAGLLLALIGVFAVTMHLVSSRQREMAVRLALGATPATVRRLVLRSVAATLAVGAAVGAGGGFVLTHSLSALLFNVSARDPSTFLTAASIVLVIGLLAGDVPARRAAHIDPVRALARD